MAQSSGDCDKETQYYPTPMWAVTTLLSKLDIADETIYDPCAGTGSILHVARSLGAGRVYGHELDDMRARLAYDQGLNVTQGDGLLTVPERDAIVLINPPFKGNSWRPWLDAYCDHPSAWMLLPNTVFSAANHCKRLRHCNPHVLLGRVKFTGSTPTWGCAWWWIGSGTDPLEGEWLL